MSQPLIYITRKSALIFSVFLLMYEFLTYIANDMIMPVMLGVIESFNASSTVVATSLTMYTLGGASLQILLGPLSDRYGRRPVMLFGAAFFFVCTIAIACTQSINQFLLARFFQGMGLCFICVIGYATLQEIFDEMDAIRLIALMANISTIAPLIGPILGASVIAYISWRMIFVVIGTLSLIALWGLWKFMPESVGQLRRDGTMIKKVSLSPRSVISNYMSLLHHGAFIFGALAIGISCVPCLTWIALAPVILVKQAHLTLIQYALWQVPVFGALILGNIILHYLTNHAPLLKLIIVGSVVMCLGLLSMVLANFIFDKSFLFFMPGLIVYFLGLGLLSAPIGRYILFSTAVSKGTASALLSMIVMSTQAIGIEIMNCLYINHNNLIFSLFCACVGVIYSILLFVTVYLRGFE